MNIFIVDESPIQAARDLCNKHVTKMIIESAQILCTVYRIRWSERWNVPDKPELFPTLYRSTHIHHPAVKWTAGSVHNTDWLWHHVVTLEEEYRHRFNRVHKTALVIPEIHNRKWSIWIADGDWTRHTPFAQCMPERYRSNDPISSYRAYYIGEKSKFARWSPRTTAPVWW